VSPKKTWCHKKFDTTFFSETQCTVYNKKNKTSFCHGATERRICFVDIVVNCDFFVLLCREIVFFCCLISNCPRLLMVNKVESWSTVSPRNGNTSHSDIVGFMALVNRPLISRYISCWHTFSLLSENRQNHDSRKKWHNFGNELCLCSWISSFQLLVTAAQRHSHIWFCLFSLKSENVRIRHELGGSPNTCYISHSANHRKMADFDLSGSENPWTDVEETWHVVGYVRDQTSNDNFDGGSATWVVWANMWLVTSLSFFSFKMHECIFIDQISLELHSRRRACD